jgi:cytochrome c biogenesis factor
MFSKSKKHCVLIVLLLLVALSNTYAQTNNTSLSKNDSIQVNDYKFSYKQLIVPVSLMLYGTDC